MPVSVLAASCEDLDRQCAPLAIPSAVILYLRQITGGYPEIFTAVLEWWLNNGRPGIAPEVRRKMLAIASDQATGFVEWLDPLEDGTYRDFVIDLYHGVDVEKTLDAFHNHPWRELVLEGNGLRAEAVGVKALDVAIAGVRDNRTAHSPWYDVLDRASRLYRRRQYSPALRSIEAVDVSRLRPHHQLLQAHARVMLALAGGDGEDYFGADTDCRRLRQALHEAEELLSKVALPMAPLERTKIQSRYSDLKGVAAAVTAAATVTGPFRHRLVDVLSGFAEPAHTNKRGAALVLLLKAEAGRAIAGDASACQFMLALPEQIFRAWALWAVNVNYYNAPAHDEAVWRIVEQNWPAVHGEAQRPTPGMPFPSFYVFAYYALAAVRSLAADAQRTAPEPEFGGLHSALSSFETVRTGHAHGVHLTTKHQRQTYSELIDRWLTSLLSTSPDIGSREELLALTEPLPIVNADGTVSW